jgi:hypothetical protein
LNRILPDSAIPNFPVTVPRRLESEPALLCLLDCQEIDDDGVPDVHISIGDHLPLGVQLCRTAKYDKAATAAEPAAALALAAAAERTAASAASDLHEHVQLCIRLELRRRRLRRS